MTGKIQSLIHRPMTDAEIDEAIERNKKCKGFRGYWDREKQKFVEGVPPAREVLDTAPYFFTDDIKPFKHPYTGEVCTTRKQLDDNNKASGCIECKEAIPKPQKDYKKIEAAYEASIEKAVAAIDNGMAPLSEKARELCKRQDELLEAAIPGLDAKNCLGRKKHGKRKRY